MAGCFSLVRLVNLNRLEEAVVQSVFLQQWVVRAHARALAKVTAGLPAPNRIAIIGGGLFPRTALVAHTLWPGAHVSIIDANAAHLETCRRWLRGDETLICARVSGDALPKADLVIVPLAFDQDKRLLYHSPKSGNVIVHDWLWKARGHSSVKQSAIASILLLKRVNLMSA
jgi:hypothetical protein